MERPATRNNKQKFKQMMEEDRAAGTVAKAKGKTGKCIEICSTEGIYGRKGKGSICSVDGTIESDGWTQSDVTNSEDDLYFCIMENSQDVVTVGKHTIVEHSANGVQ